MTADSAALRVGHTERHRAVELLKTAYADGRLDQSELEERAVRALSARTAADLDAPPADLGASSAAVTPSQPGQSFLPAGRPVHGALEPLARLVRCVLCCGR